MAKDFAERLVKASGTDKAVEIANRTGVAVRLIRKYLAGEVQPTRANLGRIAQATNVRLEWLGFGDGAGPMRQAPGFPDRLRESIGAMGVGEVEFAAKARIDVEKLRRLLSGAEQPEMMTVLRLSNATNRRVEWFNTGALPVMVSSSLEESMSLWNRSLIAGMPDAFEVQYLPAGTTQIVQRHLVEWLGLGKTNSIAVLVQHDEAMTPAIEVGDRLLIDKTDPPRLLRLEDEGVFVFLVENSFQARRVANRRGKIEVKADNPKVSLIDVTASALVFGRVVGVVKRNV